MHYGKLLNIYWRKKLAYKSKSEHEKNFIAHIIEIGGIKTYGNTDENGHTYWFFDLVNGERKYWTNLAEESQKALGINDQ